MPLVHRLPRPEPLRQVTPLRPRPNPEQHTVDHLPVVTPPTAPTAHLGQERPQPLPLLIRQITPTIHD